MFCGEDRMIVQAYRTARGYAKRRFKHLDPAFVEEAIAEAYYIAWELIYLNRDEILEKYPDKEERHKFYRMTIGYRLQHYFCHWRKTLEFDRLSKGINLRPKPLTPDSAVIYTTDIDIENAYEFAVRDEFERLVCEYYIMGNRKQLIAEKLGCTKKRIGKTLARIRRRLRQI